MRSFAVALTLGLPGCVPNRFFQQVSLFGAPSGPVSLALTRLADGASDPWFMASSEPTNQGTFDEYALRFAVEESFRDDKSDGFQLQHSRLTVPGALERLWLVLALVTLYLTSLGTKIVQEQRRCWVDP